MWYWRTTYDLSAFRLAPIYSTCLEQRVSNENRIAMD